MTFEYRYTHRYIMIAMCIVLWHVCNFAATITVTDFGDYQVIQRSIGDTSAAVTVSGTYSGIDVDHIQARVVKFIDGSTVADWQTISSGLSGGTYSGPIVVPQGGWYRIAVSGRNASETEVCHDTGTHRWGVGINVLCIGQSNMVGNGNIRSGYTAVKTDLAGLYSNSNAWKKLSDPYDSGGVSSEIDYDSWYGASMIPSFANSLSDAFPTIPIGIVPAAKGGSPLHGTADTCWITRDPANHANPQNLYGNSIANARAVGGVELIIMHQGETDATNNASEAQYKADFDTLVAHYRQDLYSSIPLFFCQLGRSFTSISAKNRTDTTMQRIRNAQHDLDDPANKVYLSALCIDLPVVAGDDHYMKTGHDTIGGRLANAVKFYYGVQTHIPPCYRGPEITSASFADSSKKIIDVIIAHRGGNDFTPSNNIAGFQVTSDADTQAISSAVQKSADTIRLTLAKTITGTAAVRYLVGKHPNPNDTFGVRAVHDNTPLRLPLEPTTSAIIVPHINTLSITIAGHGTVTKDPNQAFYLDNSTVHLTALPQTGYHFLSWGGDLTGTNSDTTIILTANRSITATFAMKQFSLSVTSTNGTVAKSPSQTMYDSNTVVQLTATPATGYTFTGWSGDASGSANPLGVTMNGNKTITANFAIKQYSITLTSTNGTVAKAPNQTLYDSNTVVQLNATPNAGYNFTGWSGDLSGSTNPVSITMTAAKNITANFTIYTYSVTVSSAGNGAVRPAGLLNVNYGDTLKDTATPNPGYNFVNWSVTGGIVTTAAGQFGKFAVTGSGTIQANFAIKTYTFTLTAINGSVTKSPDQAQYDSGSTVTLTPVPATGYHFTGWSGDLSGIANPATIIMTAAKNISAGFALKQYSLTITAANGSITKSPDQAQYDSGNTVTLMAIPATGYHFTGWSGDLSGTTNPASITMTAAKNIAANFVINAPAAPTLLSPVNNAANVTVSPVLSWNAAAGASFYRVQLSTNSSFTSVVTDDSMLTANSKSVSSLSNSTTYYWQVNARNIGGVSAWSAAWSFTTIVPLPSPVVLLSPANAARILTDTAVFLWNKASPDVDKYLWEIATDSLMSATVSVDSALIDTFKIYRALQNKKTYWWHAKAHNISGWGAYGEVLKFAVDMPATAVVPKSFSLGFGSMRSNGPVINFAVPVACLVTIDIYNIRGQLVKVLCSSPKAPGYYRIAVNGMDLSKGYYMLDFKAGPYAVKKGLPIFD